MSTKPSGPSGELPVLLPVSVLLVCLWWIAAGFSSAYAGTGSEIIGLPHLVLALVAAVFAVLQLGIRNHETAAEASFISRNAYSMAALAILLLGAVLSVLILLP